MLQDQKLTNNSKTKIMKRKIALGLFSIVVGVFSMSFTADEPALGKETSSIVWTGKKVTGEHTGTIDFKHVAWKFDGNGALISANFSVDMTTIVNTDLGGEYKGKLEGHLASEDFFNTAKFPTADFVTTSVKPLGKGAYEISGDLTIKGIKESLTFEAMVKDDGHMKHATATVSIDRTKYGVKYGSGKFFDNLGDKMIDDEFILQIDIKKH